MMDGQRRHGDAGGGSPHEIPSTMRRRRPTPDEPSPWSPAASSFAPIRRPAARNERRFAPTEHLAPEAVAAFVDGELGSAAHMRATHHLALCPECVAAVDVQMAARARLRAAGTVSIPTDLLGQLSQIPTREIDMSEHLDPQGNGDSRRSRRRPTDASPMLPDMTRGRIQRWRGR